MLLILRVFIFGVFIFGVFILRFLMASSCMATYLFDLSRINPRTPTLPILPESPELRVVIVAIATITTRSSMVWLVDRCTDTSLITCLTPPIAHLTNHPLNRPLSQLTNHLVNRQGHPPLNLGSPALLLTRGQPRSLSLLDPRSDRSHLSETITQARLHPTSVTKISRSQRS